MARKDDGWLKDEDEVGTKKEGEMKSAPHRVIDVTTRWQENIGRGREVYLVGSEGQREDDEQQKERGREERVYGGRLWISNMVGIGSRKGKSG